MRIERKQFITRFFTVIISVVLFLTLFFTFILFPVFVRSDSMESDIARNSAVFVTPLVRTPSRGDVVLLNRMDDNNIKGIKLVINKIVGFFTAQQIEPFGYSNSMTAKNSVRRVVALPGDTIYMQDYVLYVKPAGEKHFLTEFEIVENPYNVTFYVPPAEWDTEIGVKGSFDEFTLGYNEYFVLADNRKSSDDSRLWGAVKKEDISAKILLCYFPFRNFKLF